MQRYKSIFTESGGSLEVEFPYSEKLVDISNLQWSKDMGAMPWDKAQSACPPGWRMPTIQELHTAHVQKVPGFKPDHYWSSSTYSNSDAWYFAFRSGYWSYDRKSYSYYVRCVREI